MALTNQEVRPPSLTRLPPQVILVGGLIVGIAVRLWVILHGLEDGDVRHLHGIGVYWLQGNNPYRLPPFESNFPPIALFLEAGAVIASRLTNVPFHILFKFWPLASDLGTALVIYFLLRRTGQSSRRAAMWAVVFILNPVSILITAAHGNLDPVTNFLSVAALALMVWNPRRLFAWSALALGIAIGIKPNPVFLLPILACYQGLSFRQRLAFCVICALPAGLTFIPFFIDTPSGVIGNVFGYTGESDFGYAVILRMSWYFKTGSLNLPGSVAFDLASATRLTFIASYIALLAYGAGRVNPARLVTLSYLLFYVLFTGLSAQYFVWIVPFAIIAGDWLIFLYSMTATLGLIGFYVFFFPPVLFGTLYTIKDQLRVNAPLYSWGGLAMWCGNVLWLIISIRGLFTMKSKPTSWDALGSAAAMSRPQIMVNRLRLFVVAAALVIFALSMVPVVRVVAFMITALRA